MSDISTPKHLRIVSWAFIFVGFYALANTLYTLFVLPAVNIDFLIVFVFVGFGLMKRKPMWRSFALACATVVLIFSLGNVIIILLGQKDLTDVAISTLIMFWISVVLGIACSGYALWALQSKEVREAFESGS